LSDVEVGIAVMDAAGNKVAERVNEVWRFAVYDAFGRLVADYGGLGQTDEGGVKFVQQDIQGSTRCVTSISGNVLGRMDYQAFGEQIPSNIGQRTAVGFMNADSIRHRYALTENDTATGLNDTWWRKLENRSGRWTSPDPYNGSMSLGDPQSFNRNSYVQNDPVNFIDPSGLFKGPPRAGCQWDGEHMRWDCPPLTIPWGGHTTWDDVDPNPSGIEIGAGGGDSCTTRSGKKVVFKNWLVLSDEIKSAMRQAMDKESLEWSPLHSGGADNQRTLGWLIANESTGRVGIRNKQGSTATGLMQLTKVNWHYYPNGGQSIGNAVEEIQGGIRYALDRYGSLQAAVDFWKEHCWY